MATSPRTLKSKGTAITSPPRLYGDLAWLWPILSPPEHYEQEAATLCEEFGRRAASVVGRKPRLLDLGAGGGHVLVHLQGDFDCTAVDCSPTMLDNCARLVPDARRIEADYRTLRLDETFDMVLLHDGVDYMTSEADLAATLATAAAHLAPGGVLFVAPTYTRDNFEDGEVADDATADGDLTYFSFVHDPDPSDTQYELILLYLIRDEHTRQVEVVEDRHRCGLFAEQDWLRLLAQAGVPGEQVEDDKAWTLFAGRKRPTGR
jgi:SAM-dependent methyltransferase